MIYPDKAAKILSEDTSIYNDMTEEEFIYLKSHLVKEFPELNNLQYDNKNGILELFIKGCGKNGKEFKQKLQKELDTACLTKVWTQYLTNEVLSPDGDIGIKKAIRGKGIRSMGSRIAQVWLEAITYTTIAAVYLWGWFPILCDKYSWPIVYMVTGLIVMFLWRVIYWLFSVRFKHILRKGW